MDSRLSHLALAAFALLSASCIANRNSVAIAIGDRDFADLDGDDTSLTTGGIEIASIAPNGLGFEVGTRSGDENTQGVSLEYFELYAGARFAPFAHDPNEAISPWLSVGLTSAHGSLDVPTQYGGAYLSDSTIAPHVRAGIDVKLTETLFAGFAFSYMIDGNLSATSGNNFNGASVDLDTDGLAVEFRVGGAW